MESKRISEEILLSQTDVIAQMTGLISKRQKIEDEYQQIYHNKNYTQQQIKDFKEEYLGKEQKELKPYIELENDLFDIVLKEGLKEKGSFNIVFASDEFKKWLTQQSDYIKLKEHINNSKSKHSVIKVLTATNRKKYVEKLEKMISTAKGADWFFNMNEEDHPLNKLDEGSKATDETRKLIHNLKMTIVLGALQQQERFGLNTQQQEQLDSELFENSSTLPRSNRFKRYFDYNKPTKTKRLKNRLAKKINQAEHFLFNQNKFDEIDKSGILLGIIPTVGLIKKIEEIYKKNLTIAAVVDTFEFTSGLDTLQPHQCRKHGWKHVHLPMTDYTQNMESENLLDIAKEIHEAKKRGDIVYVHCKAGKARSALALAIYFAVYDADFIESLYDKKFLKTLFDEDFINSLPEGFQKNPGFRLNAAVRYIKKFRSQVDLHDELIDQYNQKYNTNAWLILTPELQAEIEKMFPGKNIGKLCNGYNTIRVGLDRPNYKLLDVLDASQENLFISEKFIYELVQSFAFKELMVFTWKIQKYDLGENVRVKYLDDFLSHFKDNPSDAIKELQANFVQIDADTNVGKLLLNSKADQVLGILQRLYIGVQNYVDFKCFEPTLEKTFNLNPIQLDRCIEKVPDKTEGETYEIVSQLMTWCDKSDTNLSNLNKKFQQILTNPCLKAAFVNNLYQACQVHEIYQSQKWDDALRKESLELLEDPFGIILAKLNPGVLKEKNLIDSILNLNKAWIEGLSIVSQEKRASLTDDIPLLPQRHSVLFTINQPPVDPLVNANIIQETAPTIRQQNNGCT